MTMVMDRNTGKALEGLDSLRQRLTDCLSFQRGTLVGARDYGADLLGILDRNMNPDFFMDAFVAVSEAVNNPANGLDDFRLSQMGISAASENHVELTVLGEYVPTGKSITLEGLTIYGR